ncbi:sulfotransferase family protein [Pelagibius marinus]|uniref:sulfotransferase family protein n=1 Tax=Pelagibius marinus TaxID=2762760 RepID=UPI0018725167|nr:sulfotransferase [Pelagibius marinus]
MSAAASQGAGAALSAEEQKPPIFLLGAQRSGTTMLRLMLNNHHNLAIPHETAFITIYFQRLGDYGDLGSKDNARRLLDDVARHPLVRRGNLIADPEAVLAREIGDYKDFVDAIYRCYAAARGKVRWGDKTPFYTPDIDIIRRIFPHSKIVHLVRDGRDVVLSQRSIEWMSGNLPKLVLDWQWKTTIAHKVGAVLGDDFLEVRYEDLVRRPEEVLREICTFIDEDYDPSMLNYWADAESVVPRESLKWHRNSVQPPDPGKLQKWKKQLSKSERIVFEQLAGETLDLFGYEREHMSPTIASRALKVYHTLLKRK